MAHDHAHAPDAFNCAFAIDIALNIAFVIVLGTGRLFIQSLHLMFDGVPDSVDLAAVHAFLASQPGVEDVHDLHVWAMSTSDIALTAHVVMPAGHPGDAFFAAIADALHDRFEITHPTIQVEIGRLEHGCRAPELK